MNKSANKPFYVSFPIEPELNLILKAIAQKQGKTHPELLHEICTEYIRSQMLDEIEKELNVIE